MKFLGIDSKTLNNKTKTIRELCCFQRSNFLIQVGFLSTLVMTINDIKIHKASISLKIMEYMIVLILYLF